MTVDPNSQQRAAEKKAAAGCRSPSAVDHLWSVNNFKHSRKSSSMFGTLSMNTSPQEFQECQPSMSRLSLPIGHIAIVIRLGQRHHFQLRSIQSKLFNIHHGDTTSDLKSIQRDQISSTSVCQRDYFVKDRILQQSIDHFQ